MKNTEIPSRRKFVKLAIGTLASIPVIAATAVRAEDEMLDEGSTQASSLGYKADTTTVDAAKHPNHTAAQMCENCALYTGAEGGESGPCAIFPGKAVAAQGWCQVYAPAPS